MQTIQDYIKNNKINDLKNFITNNHDSVNDADINYLLIFAIKSNTNIEIIDYLINQKENNNKDINFNITYNHRTETPLLSAITNNNYNLADSLIEKYGADINYGFDIKLLLRNNQLNYKQMKYIFSKSDNKLPTDYNNFH